MGKASGALSCKCAEEEMDEEDKDGAGRDDQADEEADAVASAVMSADLAKRESKILEETGRMVDVREEKPSATKASARTPIMPHVTAARRC